jgi:hypothetical protein
MPVTASPGNARSSIAFVGVLVMLCAAGTRLLASYDPVPVWGGDPLTVPVPISGLTPAGSLLVDVVLALGAALAAFGSARPAGLAGWSWLLLVPGVMTVAYHARPSQPNALDNLVQGSAWVGALCAGWCAHNACADLRCRRALSAGLYAFLAILCLKGVVQFFIEHPRTLEAFRADKGAFLASQGWSEDSPMARAYERRLSQPEATGWFGMANVYAGVMAGACVAVVGGICAAWPRRGGRAPCVATSRKVFAVLLVGVLCGVLGVALAGSKGGYAFFNLGVMLLLLARALSWRTVPPALGTALGTGVLLAVTGAVILRGLIGTRLGELSVLFRWFYIDAAAHIFLGHPLLGTGPAGFKDAYMLAKTPLSPEDVGSPHCLPMDWIATLGLGGIAWTALWLCWVGAAGRRLISTRRDSSPVPPFRPDAPWLILAISIPVVLGARFEFDVATPEGAVVRSLGLVLSVALALAIGAMFVHDDPSRRWVEWGLAGAGLVLAASAQFDLTGSAIGSCAWVALGVGLAGASRASSADGGPRTTTGFAPALVPLLALATVLSAGQVARVWTWESSVRAAAAEAARIGEFALRARQLSLNRGSGDSWPGLLADLNRERRMVGLVDDALRNTQEFHLLLADLRRVRVRRAISHLEQACSAEPSHLPTSQALSRLVLLEALEHPPGDEDGVRGAEQALVVARMHAERFPSASAHGWLGTISEAAGTALGRREWLIEAVEAWERASAMAPHAVVYPVALARTCNVLGETERSRKWALQALENDAKTSLDPLQGLSDRVREEMRALAGLP